MNDRSSQLPWEELRHTEGPIPWSALETCAEAMATDADVIPELFEAYQQARQTWHEEVCYLDLYVPAILALAVPRLSGEQRRIIGEFLLQRLIEAGEDDDDLALQVSTAACGTIGPVILPVVLDTLEQRPDCFDAWFWLWSLTGLASQTEDAAIRERTVQVCVRLLERIDRGETQDDFGIGAAWTLALLGRTDQIELLQRLSRECPAFFGGADYRDAAERLLGRSHFTPVPESWERPVREWLEPRWEMAKKWFADREVRDFEMASTESEEELAASEPEAFDQPDPSSFTPTIPIVEHRPKVGRNDPCPCGSGRKYKKCCGSPTQDQTVNA